MDLQVEVQKARTFPFMLLWGDSEGLITSFPETTHSLLRFEDSILPKFYPYQKTADLTGFKAGVIIIFSDDEYGGYAGLHRVRYNLMDFHQTMPCNFRSRSNRLFHCTRC